MGPKAELDVKCLVKATKVVDCKISVASQLAVRDLLGSEFAFLPTQIVTVTFSASI